MTSTQLQQDASMNTLRITNTDFHSASQNDLKTD